jgi:ribonuclease HII
MEKPIVIRRSQINTIRKNSFERNCWAQNLFVCGIDEAGRGPLAGPVVAAAVIVTQYCTYRLLKDSKILTEAERTRAYAWIKEHCWYGIGIENQVSIDTHNIYQASLRAMQRAFCQLTSATKTHLGAILVDAMPLTLRTEGFTNIPVHAFIEAESLSISVAAASIIAKVTRDRLMQLLAQAVPGYSFHTHKGYATPEHQAALRELGKSIVHRESFVTKFEKTGSWNEFNNQATIW